MGSTGSMGNRGFVELANPAGQMLVMFAILVLGVIIIGGGLFWRAMAAEDKKKRVALREELLKAKAEREEAQKPQP